MKQKTKQIIKIGAVYAGAVLGAGFASGQELLVFFVRYGARGLVGSMIAGILFALVGAMVLSRAKMTGQTSYVSYLKMILGEKAGGILYFAVELFMAVSFCVMLSGSGALFSEQFNLPPIVGVLFTSIVCFFVLQGNLSGLTMVNMLLVPFMISGMILVCVGYLFTQYSASWLSFGIGDGKFMWSVILYVSFNMLTATAVLVPLSSIADTKKRAAAGGVLGGSALLLAAVAACTVLYIAYGDVAGSQLPLLALSQRFSRAASFVYSAVLYMALLTTAAANGFSVVEHFAGKGAGRRLSSALLCIASVPLSLIPFSRLVESCYTFFGIIGLAVLCGAVYDWFKN